jgi:adenosylcobinamide-phosphate synthase
MVGFELWYLIPAAFFLDLVMGDPPRLPHPIRWMGAAIFFLEPYFRKIPVDRFTSGFFFSTFLIAGTWGIIVGVLTIAQWIHPVIQVFLSVVLLYYSISVRSLKTAAMHVYNALVREGLTAARERVSHIIGRDVDRLSETDVASGAVESVAENLVDGVISPLFYAALGGAPLAMAFKMANTLDSMIGYKNERYLRFGKTAARIDDAANFLPARLAVPVISVAAQIMFKRGASAFRTAMREGDNHTSPNAGYPEAGFAGALGVKLNGPSDYGGTRVDKPFIGIGHERPTPYDIKLACDLMLFSAVVALLFIWGGRLLVSGLI